MICGHHLSKFPLVAERLARLNFFLLSARHPTHHAKSFVTKPASSSYTRECNVRINEFGHRGSVEEAKKLFDKMPHSLKDAASYVSMINVYLKNDDLPKAETLFHSLPYRNIFAESAMIQGYVMAVVYLKLVDCSMTCRAGLMEKEQKLFDSIHAFGLQPKAKHYSCLVGILGRAGQLDKAMSVVKKMPPSKRDGSFLGALLAARRAHGGHKIANHISKQLIELEPTDSGVYVLLADVYAAHEKWDEFAQVRKMMRERKLKKVASFSQVEVKGKNHVFFVEDRSDPQVEGIHEMLRLMHYHLLRPRWVTLDEIEHLNVSLLTQLLDLQGAEEKCSQNSLTVGIL
uniref:Pentacotripeptide-repeat region of PRORP domain-containing protein n=1 Tax=Gossypium raimondii TaxID=29730 RepID=A0A0D2TM65_GOSRA|nr:hypothetical protein B456_009G185400 [Gossypium raimondii]